jgi:hypothetical protein
VRARLITASTCLDPGCAETNAVNIIMSPRVWRWFCPGLRQAVEFSRSIKPDLGELQQGHTYFVRSRFARPFETFIGHRPIFSGRFHGRCAPPAKLSVHRTMSLAEAPVVLGLVLKLLNSTHSPGRNNAPLPPPTSRLALEKLSPIRALRSRRAPAAPQWRHAGRDSADLRRRCDDDRPITRPDSDSGTAARISGDGGPARCGPVGVPARTMAASPWIGGQSGLFQSGIAVHRPDNERITTVTRCGRSITCRAF